MEGISRADVSDAAAILGLQKLAFQSEAALYGDWTIPPLVQTLDEITAEFGEKTFLKACMDGRLVGSVRAGQRGEICHIGRLIVHPEFQRRGVGSRLMAAVEAEFPTAARFELGTGSRSEGNIRLYERLGYRVVRTDRLSERVPLVCMEKLRG
jgi:ribosomal protein S18 acetylase RimI-like enzyme